MERRNQRGKKVMISMAAERAGVSRGTINRVLNRRPHVKPDAYESVRPIFRMRALSGWTASLDSRSGDRNVRKRPNCYCGENR